MATPPINESETGSSETTTPRRRSATRRASTGSRRSAGGRAAGVSRNVDAAAGDLAELQADLARLSRSIAALLSSQATTARETVRGAASEIYDSGLDVVQSAEKQARTALDDISQQIKRNPLAAAGIVFGIGYIIGLMRRR